MKKVLYTIVLLFYFLSVRGQDMGFSQFIYNPIFLNPAACGIERGLRVSVNYHREMMFSTSKFETTGVSFDQSLHDLNIKGLGGTGFFLMKTQEGDGKMNTISIGVPLTARVEINEFWTMQASIAPVIYEKFIDWNKLVFGDQLDPYYGVVLPTTQTGFGDARNNINFFDFHAGLWARYESDPTFQVNTESDVLDMGISAQHVPEPNQSFFSQVSNLPTHYIFMARYSKNLSTSQYRSSKLQPFVMFEKQSSMQDWVIGTNYINNGLNVGAYIRKQQNSIMKLTEIIFMGGIEFPFREDLFSSMRINYSCAAILKQTYVKPNLSPELSIILKLPSVYRKQDPCRMYF
ncbi:MAG: PorP/SprF family type IX secretion system membrane protein [Bacteroidota bacterium]|nr:PorP/SprF family type IX secretion system membrane protein [Bacteroidota bacterium]